MLLKDLYVRSFLVPFILMIYQIKINRGKIEREREMMMKEELFVSTKWLENNSWH
jgi:hypothetical protein